MYTKQNYQEKPVQQVAEDEVENRNQKHWEILKTGQRPTTKLKELSTRS